MRSTGIAVFLVLAALGFCLLREGALPEEEPGAATAGLRTSALHAPDPGLAPVEDSESGTQTEASPDAPGPASGPQMAGARSARGRGDAPREEPAPDQHGAAKQPTDLRFWAGYSRASKSSTPAREARAPDDSTTPEPPEVSDLDPPATSPGIPVGQESYVYVGTQRTAISGADVASMRVDPATRAFEAQQLALPPVDFPSGDSFEFGPFDMAGQISAGGDLSIPVSLEVTTPSGTKTIVELTFTTQVSSLDMPDGTRIDYQADPFLGNDSSTLVGSALLPDGVSVVVVLEVGN